MNRSKSGTKINLNKSITNKSYNEIKLNLSNNKTSSNLHDYIKSKKNKNSFSSNSNVDESLYENNLINSYKNKIEEKEKELNCIKEKLITISINLVSLLVIIINSSFFVLLFLFII